eukprot:m.22825 g.22825  ORF g.22825 m.22825 type:complete len:434 (+) comp13962_c0_seq1:228-1529(+)
MASMPLRRMCGSLSTLQIDNLREVLDSTIIIDSGLPAVEVGFHPISLHVGRFVLDLLQECNTTALKTTTFISGHAATKVIGATSPIAISTPTATTPTPPPRLNNEQLSTIAEPPRVPMNVADVANVEAANEVARTVEVLCWCDDAAFGLDYTTKLNGIDDTVREHLNLSRNVVINCLRNCMNHDDAEADSDDEPMDHMIAAAYLRQMMVVDSNEFGPNCKTSVFKLEPSHDTVGVTLVLKFVVGGYCLARGSGMVEFPTQPTTALIRLHRTTLRYLTTVCKSPSREQLRRQSTPAVLSCNDSGIMIDDGSEDDNDGETHRHSDHARSEFSKTKPWQEDFDGSVTFIPFAREISSHVPKADDAVEEKTPYWDQLLSGVDNARTHCFHSCFGFARQHRDGAPKSSQTPQTTPTLSQRSPLEPPRQVKHICFEPTP